MRAHRARRAVSGQGGFTLLELLLVLAIIAVVAGMVMPRFANRSRGAKMAAARADIEANLATALELYELDSGQFPTTQQGLRALVERPESEPRPRNWAGPYVRGDVPTDPWGQPYRYRSPADASAMAYELWSMGPDGRDGGGDDISNRRDHAAR